MGGTTIRRLANPIGWDASVQRFVIPAADVSRIAILATQQSDVELVFAWIEHVNCMSSAPSRTSFCYPVIHVSNVNHEFDFTDLLG